MEIKEKLYKISVIEGISLLILFFLAMPLKYIYEYKIATLIAGSIHGILWLMFVYLLIKANDEIKFTKEEMVKLIITSVVPFGFVFAKRIINEKN